MNMKRILFVDDEIKVLEGLKRMLYLYEGEWDMLFVSSGEAALGQLRAGHFDVIISDMRMPGMDGAALLKRVREEYPDTVRIVLSGHTEMDAAMRAVPVAHQFLIKPCEAAFLKGVVERAMTLRQLLDSGPIREVVGKMDQLPVLPEIYFELTQVLADTECSLTDVSKLVERDMALTAKILQLVNSAFFGLPRRVTSIFNAVSMVGANMIKNLSLTFEVLKGFESERDLPGFSFLGQARHSLLVGNFAKRLLPNPRQAEDAFVAAMIHDVGKLILATKLPGEFRRALTEWSAGHEPFHVIEKRLLGVTHAEIGAYLLGVWGLPYSVVEAVAYHHEPSGMPQESFGVLGAVHVANALVHEKTPSLGEGRGDGLDLQYLAQMGMEGQLPVWRQWAREMNG